jgi:hypothetical protein
MIPDPIKCFTAAVSVIASEAKQSKARFADAAYGSPRRQKPPRDDAAELFNRIQYDIKSPEFVASISL